MPARLGARSPAGGATQTSCIRIFILYGGVTSGVETRLSIVQRKEQALAMSMGMRMSLTLLGMSSEDLEEAVKAERARNPFLRLMPYPAPPAGGGSGGSSSLEAVAAEPAAAEDILQQIALLKLPPDQRELAARLVYCLDERGFLADPLDEMCAYLETGPDMLKSVVAKLQMSVEPAGIFAWSLIDCFRIQLLSLNRLDPIILQLLDRLDLVAQQDVTAICELCAVDAEDAIDMIAEIRALNPSPLIKMDPAPLVGQEPELIILPDDAGRMSVTLNPSAFPDILADDGLFNRVRAVELDQAAIKYYRDCHRGAAAYVLSLQKRANTLLRIGREIADIQSKFLTSGHTLDLRPMTTSMLADTLGLNKSTISRALSNCRVMTRHGIRNSEEFLVRPISKCSKEKSQGQALQRLSVLIRAEDKRSPYSDLELAALMAKVGFDLSRRTVAKYRDLLGVPGKAGRRSS